MQKLTVEVAAESAGARLDKFLATNWPDYSRTLLATLVRDGGVSIEGIKPAKIKPALKLEGGEKISIELPAIEEMDLEPEEIPLQILFEDDAIVLINKQAALSNLDHWQLEVDELFITQELTAGSEDGICETATSRSNP